MRDACLKIEPTECGKEIRMCALINTHTAETPCPKPQKSFMQALESDHFESFLFQTLENRKKPTFRRSLMAQRRVFDCQ